MIQGKGGSCGKSEDAKEWLTNIHKALASLLRRLCVKVAEALLASLEQSFAGSSIGQRLSGLDITKPMGIGCRYQRVALYIHSQEKVTLLQPPQDLLQFQSCLK